MTTIFLHGGGDDPAHRLTTFGRFAQAAMRAGAGRLALVCAEATEAAAQQSAQDYQAIFAALAMAELAICPLLVTPAQPLTRVALEALAPTGVFVCGGNNSLYHQALCTDLAWVAYLQAANLPYGGTSAGAAIAAAPAILGGWLATRQAVTRAILFRGASEGLDELTVRPGLGLVPFAVEAHASQMGTLTRLIHAVDLGLAPEGWAIDENTMLEVSAQGHRCYGAGQAYHVQRNATQGVNVTVY